MEEGSNHPAVGVSWHDLQEFVHRLNQAAGDSLYRLPTEAEWEYACRANTTTRWSFGNSQNQLSTYAVYDRTSGQNQSYTRVGTKQPSPWGLYDMHGNVKEHCQDGERSYSEEPQIDPMGPASSSTRVTRGGDFFSPAESTRSASRVVKGMSGMLDRGARILLISTPAPANTPPEANAGPDQTVEVGTTVQLDGSGSRDADGAALRFTWTANPDNPVDPTSTVTGSSMDTSAERPTFMPAMEGVYRFTLVVSDGQVDSAPDEVIITVEERVPEPPGETITVDLPGGATMDFVWIEPGTFMMGSPESEEGREDNEGPQHEVTISQGFYLGKYETTQEQWYAAMGAKPWEGVSYVQSGDRNPVAYISWNDAQQFIGKLNEYEGESVYRLPTEGEWEYACRAGTITRWSFGDDESQLGDYAWYYDNAWTVGEKYAHAVGTKEPNPWGLYDTHGNVWEWCQDWYGSYSSNAQTDPAGPSSGSNRVVRGGFFGDLARNVRSANRDNSSPDDRGYYIGFRLLRMAEPISKNAPPNANAGPDQTVEVGATVQLNGSGSSDTNGDILIFTWTESADNPATGLLSDTSSDAPTFTPSIAGEYQFSLVVYDGQIDSTPDEVVIMVEERLPEPPGEIITVDLPGGATMEMVWIEPGTFTMGSPESEEGRDSDEGPQHEVTISQGFYLGKYEVTQGEWGAVMGSNPSDSKGPKRPVDVVSWNDIQGFLERLNTAARKSIYRLPTEAEWEYACRAGTKTRWSFGDDESELTNYAWYIANYIPRSATKDVGMKLPNPWGLYDMHGNVEEFCQDWYGEYSSGAHTDPTGLASGTVHVTRGGNFINFSQEMRSAHREHFSDGPGSRRGFRLLRMDEPASQNIPPEANAGPDQTVEVGTSVQLDGGNSTDSDGDILSFSWSEDNGNPTTGLLSDTSSEHPIFTPSAAGEYRFSLVVNDGQVDSAPDEVVITVNAPQPSVQELTVDLPGGATMEMVWIEPGTFMMGSPNSEVWNGSDQRPQHEVTISRGFYLGKYEVTQGEWNSVMETAPWSGQSHVQSNTNNPAVYVSWSDAQTFIERLNTAAGKNIYRLPTEAEWEYACRAGTSTRWSFGENESQLGDYAWYDDNAWDVGEQYAHSVGTKLPNPWELYDMHGNVCEWCQDWYGDYPSNAQTDPVGSATGSRRVHRGGYFYRSALETGSAYRAAGTPSVRLSSIGFRLLRTE